MPRLERLIAMVNPTQALRAVRARKLNFS